MIRRPNKSLEQIPRLRNERACAILIFLAVALLLILIQGNRFVLTNDEGIILDAAQKMAAGARLYVDFFGYMSPGSYCLQTLMFRLFGVSLLAGRIPVILDLSLQSALLYWLTARLSSRRTAAAAVLVFTGFQIADPGFLTAQHRWDSATLALAGLCLAIRPGRIRVAASGAMLAAAAWCTPPVALVWAVAAVWLAVAPERRELLLPFASGAVAVSACAAAYLATQGALTPFIRQMFWLQRNYAGVNVMPYGAVPGGYASLLEGSTSSGERIVRLLLISCLALPAILPPVAALLWGLAFWRRKIPRQTRDAIGLLLLSMAALVAGTFPRADLTHLAWVAALPYALAAAAVATLAPSRAGSMLACTLIPLACLFAWNQLADWRSLRPVSTPAGTVRISAALAPEMQNLLKEVHPGESLFVYPYMPLQYFMTRTRNPTRFSYLAPGMMTRAQELEVLSTLQSAPPQWVMFLELDEAELLRVFPSAAGRDAHFEEIESWIRKNYQAVDPAVSPGGYRLWKRMPNGLSSTSPRTEPDGVHQPQYQQKSAPPDARVQVRHHHARRRWRKQSGEQDQRAVNGQDDPDEKPDRNEMPSFAHGCLTRR